MAKHAHAQACCNKKRWIEGEEETVPVMESEEMSCMVYGLYLKIITQIRVSQPLTRLLVCVGH